MRKVLVKALFGEAEIASKMIDLLDARQKAVSQNQANNNYKVQLAYGQSALEQHKTSYAVHKAALEAAFNLELD